MQLSFETFKAAYQIRSFIPGQLKINEITYSHSLIVTAQQLITDWQVETVAHLRKEQLQPLIELKPELVLLGTGVKQVFLPMSVLAELINRDIGVEVMATNAACHTFTALIAERRNVAAALLVN